MILIEQIQKQEIVDPLQKRVLEQDIGRWVAMYDARRAKYASFQPLHTLLKNFQAFSEVYFKYFEHILDEKNSPAPIRGYIRQQALERVLDEWMTISQVVEQRELSRYQSWLHDAQKMAATFLPADAPAVVTYLGRVNTLRHLPYSRISVASIPRGVYANEKEATLALAHEVGHHVWRLTLYDQFVTKNAAVKVNEFVPRLVGDYASEAYRLDVVIMAWLEELFADVYGAFVAGADFAISLIENYVRRVNSVEDLFVNDGEHPFPYLRPLVRVKVLEHLGEPSTAEIRQRWLDFCAGKGVDLDMREIDYFIPSQAQEDSLLLGDLPLVQPAAIGTIGRNARFRC